MIKEFWAWFKSWWDILDMEFMSPEQIAYDVFGNLLDYQLLEIRDLDRADMVGYHSSMGMHIRNNYLLWDITNPYTVINPEPNEKGIIDHPKYPDQVSMQILYMVWRLVQDQYDEKEQN